MSGAAARSPPPRMTPGTLCFPTDTWWCRARRRRFWSISSATCTWKLPRTKRRVRSESDGEAALAGDGDRSRFRWGQSGTGIAPGPGGGRAARRGDRSRAAPAERRCQPGDAGSNPRCGAAAEVSERPRPRTGGQRSRWAATRTALPWALAAGGAAPAAAGFVQHRLSAGTAATPRSLQLLLCPSGCLQCTSAPGQLLVLPPPQ